MFAPTGSMYRASPRVPDKLLHLMVIGVSNQNLGRKSPGISAFDDNLSAQARDFVEFFIHRDAFDACPGTE